MEWNHITDHDLERYLGMVKGETELAALGGVGARPRIAS